jgi:hypothetical protein
MVLEGVVPEGPGSDFTHFMDLNMLVMTGGMERTAGEYEALLGRAGFRPTRIVPTGAPSR